MPLPDLALVPALAYYSFFPLHPPFHLSGSQSQPKAAAAEVKRAFAASTRADTFPASPFQLVCEIESTRSRSDLVYVTQGPPIRNILEKALRSLCKFGTYS